MKVCVTYMSEGWFDRSDRWRKVLSHCCNPTCMLKLSSDFSDLCDKIETTYRD